MRENGARNIDASLRRAAVQVAMSLGTGAVTKPVMEVFWIMAIRIFVKS
jgi:hypothetical protein